MAENGAALPEKEERLSALPDSLIQHILSFLPSTKQAIQTGILSKRWRNQWIYVSNLFFDFSGMSSHYSPENVSCTISTVSRTLDHTLSLHDFPKIQKFHIISDRFYDCRKDPGFEENVRFVVKKQAEEIILKFSVLGKFRLLEFFLAQPSLVKLQLFGCSIEPGGMVNWKSLKYLCIDNCTCYCEMIKSVLSGSPSLQSLEVKYCLRWLDRFLIASKSLKKLVVLGLDCTVDISCPDLVEFYGVTTLDRISRSLKFVCPSLESFELNKFTSRNLRIASKILKKLVLSIEISDETEIVCPRLEELDLTGRVGTIRLMNLPSSVCVSLNLVCRGTLAKRILDQLRHLVELKLGNLFLESLSDLEDGIPHPFMKCKSLTLYFEFGPSYLDTPGIAYALRSSPVLETLVVRLQPHNKHQSRGFLSQPACPGKNYWRSKGTHLSSLVSHLRTVKITGFSQWEYRRYAVLNFVKFVLKNASALEKIVVVLEDCGTDFLTEVSQKLLSFPQCSDAIIDLQCPK